MFWLTIPLSTSSLCAAVAALTSIPVAAVIDFAACNICSSKFKDSSASYKAETFNEIHLAFSRNHRDFQSKIKIDSEFKSRLQTG